MRVEACLVLFLHLRYALVEETLHRVRFLKALSITFGDLDVQSNRGPIPKAPYGRPNCTPGLGATDC